MYVLGQNIFTLQGSGVEDMYSKKPIYIKTLQYWNKKSNNKKM